jgi:16S rRNA processing protein RimM
VNQQADKRVYLGRISTVYGVKGWLKVHSQTQPRNNIFDYPVWQLKQNNQWHELKVEQGKPHGKTLVVKLAGIDDRDQAQVWVGATIAINRSQMPATQEDEHYWSDLINMQVVTTEGVALGKVATLMETGSNDVLVIRGEYQGKKTEHLVPWLVGDVIIEVNQASQQVTVDWDPEF